MEYKCFPKIECDKNLIDSIELRTNQELIEIYIGSEKLCSYKRRSYENELIDSLNIEDDLEKRLDLNELFFKNIKIERSKHKGSDMLNIAKTFFQINDQNHVALIQYLKENGSSNEHYHSTEEIIMQLDGHCIFVLRSKDKDHEYKLVELIEGNKLIIPPETIHFCKTLDWESLTFPIKRIIGKRDHFYNEKSPKRLNQELFFLINGDHYESGIEMVLSLDKYYKNLDLSNEKRIMKRLIKEMIIETENPNLIWILKEFRKRNQ